MTSAASKAFVAGLLSLSVAACSESPGPPTAHIEEGPSFPGLEYRPAEVATDYAPLGLRVRFALSPVGNAAYQSKPPSGMLLVAVDSSGALIGEYGRPGEGPGEVRSPLPFEFGDSSIKVTDASALRIVEWHLDGRLLGSAQMTSYTLPMAELDGQWLGVVPTAAGMMPAKVEARVTDPEWDEVPVGKPLVDSIMSAAVPTRRPPVLGLAKAGLLIGDGLSYRIAVVDSGGEVVARIHRNLPANLPSESQVAAQVEKARQSVGSRGPRYDEPALARITDSLRSTPRPWFQPSSPLRSDKMGRIWVVGMQEDTVFADVFFGESFLGRHILECPGFAGSWSLNGGWFGLLCQPTNNAALVDGELRRYRIIG